MSNIKNDPATDSAIQKLYSLYASENLESFRQSCINMIDSLHGKKEKLDTFKRDLATVKNKDRLVSKTTNIILAGQGLKVI